MNFSRLTIGISDNLKIALSAMAQDEMRGLKEQMLYLTIKGLEQAGYLCWQVKTDDHAAGWILTEKATISRE